MYIIIKPIFHCKLGSRWLPNVNEMSTNNLKCTRPTRRFCVGDPLARLRVLRWYPQHEIVALGVKPTPGLNANGFASQWNIGMYIIITHQSAPEIIGINIFVLYVLKLGKE